MYVTLYRWFVGPFLNYFEIEIKKEVLLNDTEYQINYLKHKLPRLFAYQSLPGNKWVRSISHLETSIRFVYDHGLTCQNILRMTKIEMMI
jgi:hypothetical protein